MNQDNEHPQRRRRSKSTAWHWQHTDACYYTPPGTKIRVPLFDERGMMWRVYSSKTRKTRNISFRQEVADLVRNRMKTDPPLGLLDAAPHQWLQHELGQLPHDAEQAIQDAAQTGALVLVERPRAAYWQGQAITVDWDRHGALWVIALRRDTHRITAHPGSCPIELPTLPSRSFAGYHQ